MLPLLSMEEAPPPQSSKQQRMMRTASISVLVMSLPVLYVSFLHVPPAALFRDTTFWFLMSNSIIIVIAADSGMLFFGSSSSASPDDLSSFAAAAPGEAGAGEVTIKTQALVVRDQLALAAVAENDDDRASYALVESRETIVSPSAAESAPGRLTAREEHRPARRRHGHRPSRSSHALVPVQDKSVVVVVASDEKQLRRAATDGDVMRPPPASRWAAADEEKESEYSRLSDEELNRRVEEFIARFNREIRLQLEEEDEEEAAAA